MPGAVWVARAGSNGGLVLFVWGRRRRSRSLLSALVPVLVPVNQRAGGVGAAGAGSRIVRASFWAESTQQMRWNWRAEPSVVAMDQQQQNQLEKALTTPAQVPRGRGAVRLYVLGAQRRRSMLSRLDLELPLPCPAVPAVSSHLQPCADVGAALMGREHGWARAWRGGGYH